MRSVLIVAALGAGALAAPAKPAPTWADWVGTYEGKLGWKSCSAPGEKTAAITLTASDGAMAIDLATAHPGLRAISLVPGDTGWSAQQGDLTVVVHRPAANTIALVVELASGCTLKARLRRKATGVPACDRLLGWARVEASCTKLGSPTAGPTTGPTTGTTTGTTTDLAKLIAAKWRKADGAKCTARAEQLERSLIDAGCAPHPDPLIGVRSPDCMTLQTTASQLDRCTSVPPTVRQEHVGLANAVVAAAQTAEPAELPVVETECRDTKALLVAVGTKFRCPGI